jgi:hypothetical protein
VNENGREREIDAAWSAASREEPPPALDAAIRAEARRAVGAAPGGVRRRHWSYPLAAVATVAALALGIAQLTPPEQVTPTSVAEQEVAPREATNETTRQSAATDTRAQAPPPAAREPVAAPAPQALAKKQLQAKQDVAERDKVAVAPAEKPAAAAAVAPRDEERMPPSPARSEPFPASPAPGNAGRDLDTGAPKSETDMPARVAAAQASRSAGAPPQASSAVGGVRAENRIEAKVAALDEAKAKDAAGRSVEDWIKRIRELRDAGRSDDAAKELAAFRSALGERADALLPPDLRAWTPSAK